MDNTQSANSRLLNLAGQLESMPNKLSALQTSSSDSLPIISADSWWSKHRRARVLDGEISYYDSDPSQSRSGRAVVFLHGNPTSSYLWRHVMPRVENIARCIAPDLIGMGRSSKIPGCMYTFADHYRYLSAWFDSLNLPRKITIVCHDWGSGLGLHWAFQHQDQIAGLVFMEGLLMVPPSLEMMPPQAKRTFGNLRSSAGEEMILKKNFFVEKMLPGSIVRKLHPQEMEAYREPYKEQGESRRPTLTWPREIPFLDSGPQYMVEIVSDYAAWLVESKDLPKLYIDGQPGFFSQGLRIITSGFENQRKVEVKGLHFLQEDSPHEIGDAVKNFVLSLKCGK